MIFQNVFSKEKTNCDQERGKEERKRENIYIDIYKTVKIINS